jgi:hypothetical protein
VSPEAARRDYGVVLAEHGDGWTVDAAATTALRAEIKARRAAPSSMIDRGPGYQAMVGRRQ